MLKSLFTSLAASLVLAAGVANAAEPAPVKMGFIDPLSGPMAVVGKPALAQLNFTAARLNKEGGIDGHKIEIVGFDNQINPQKSLVDLQKAINQGMHYIIQGNGSSVASALLNAVNKHNERNPNDRVVFLNYAAVDPVFTNARCSFWHFRFDANSDMKMNLLTDWVKNQKDIHKVFLIDQDYNFGHAVAKSAIKMLHEKRPDIKIVGDVFHPLAKVKDFSPYVSKIKASGADAVITGNWGSDMTLLIKAAASAGLNIPFLTYYGNTPGTVSEVGQKGVGRMYTIFEYNSDFKDPKMAKLENELYKQTGWDYYLRVANMLNMVKIAGDKAHSVDPTKLAYALQGLKYDSPTGVDTMRASDHQIQMPMFLTELQSGMKDGVEGTNLGWHAIDDFSAKQGEMATSCHMRRPKK